MIEPTDPLDGIVELYAAGWSTRELAQRFRCHPRTIQEDLRRRGVALRPSRRPARRKGQGAETPRPELEARGA